MSWNESEEVAARRGLLPNAKTSISVSDFAACSCGVCSSPNNTSLALRFCSGNFFLLLSLSPLRLLAMFKHSVMRAASRPLLRPANQANNTFRASPSTFYLVDRLQSKRGYATETGMDCLRAGLYCIVQS